MTDAIPNSAAEFGHEPGCPWIAGDPDAMCTCPPPITGRAMPNRAAKFTVGQAVRVTSLKQGWVKDAHVVQVENEQTLIVKLDHDNQNVFRVGAGFVSPKETP
jgi:hypothetical protein